MTMQRPRVALVSIGAVIGVLYMITTLQGLFVFREDEPKIHLLAFLSLGWMLPGSLLGGFLPFRRRAPRRCGCCVLPWCDSGA